MKQQAGPVAIVIAVILLVGIVYGIYRVSFRERPSNVRPENAPSYIQRGPDGRPIATGQPGYGQGAAYQGPGAGGNGPVGR